MIYLLGIVVFIAALYVIKFAIIAVLFYDDIQAARKRDPAAKSFMEVLLLYQGLQALVMHRVAHLLCRLRLYFAARLLSQFSRCMTGIEIHPGATIGRHFFIDHGMGVVIGETAVIGDNVLLYQGVTLGGTGLVQGKRHPTLGNNVVVGGGAKILGNITIGDNSYVGANAVVIKDVPPNSTVVGVPGRITKQDGKKIEVTLDHIHTLDPIVQNLEELEKRIEKIEKNTKG